MVRITDCPDMTSAVYCGRKSNKLLKVNLYLNFRLCQRDPHQLFLRLESQVREFVIEMKVKLLKQLSTGLKTPPQAKKFISLLLEEYAHLCKVARKMSGLLIHLVSLFITLTFKCFVIRGENPCLAMVKSGYLGLNPYKHW